MDYNFSRSESAYNETFPSSEEDTSDIDSSNESDEETSDDCEFTNQRKRLTIEARPRYAVDNSVKPMNIIKKLINREYFGPKPSNQHYRHISKCAFNKVPNRLMFCLKDIVPHCFLHGHLFMGLSACGQFLLSYKVSCNETVVSNIYSFSPGMGYKYTLYFWIYQPHVQLRNYYKCCLFDDHGVDNLKRVTLTQWKCADSRVLVIHGTSEDKDENSYITYVKVPKLGCLDCKKMREVSEDNLFSTYVLCLKCNLTVHTKYSTNETDQKFNPFVNLICPERILIFANGFVHMLHIDLEQPPAQNNNSPTQLSQTANSPMVVFPKATPPHDLGVLERRYNLAVEEFTGCDNQNNIVARIIADFSDTEADSPNSSNHRHNDILANESFSNTIPVSRKTYEEVIFTCNGSSSAVSGNSAQGTSAQAPPNNGGSTKVSLMNHKGKRHHRIVTKSFRNVVSSTEQPSTANTDRYSTYDFSEDNEKCEKISTLRKRRLAEKKYEFSEDNSENIIPFTTVRLASKSIGAAFYNTAVRSLHRPSLSGSHFSNSPLVSPSSSPHPSQASPTSTDSRHCTPPPLHRASPISLQQNFRSPPCSSPIGIMRSPSRHVASTQIKSPPTSTQTSQQLANFKAVGSLSLQVSMAKRNHFELGGSMSPNSSVPFLSPRREEVRVVEIPIQGTSVLEKPECTKKFKRRYVEEDDAATVITSEEDDCISPGYHTSLPMEVHGSCYSEMQMISQASYQQLCCPSVVITQHSFDLEAFTYYVIGTLCQKNRKNYDVFYDWACEIITICPLSCTIICLLMAQFSAREQLPTSPTNCLNCSRKLDCVFHKHRYECRILFTWNMDTGDCQVLNYGEMIEVPRKSTSSCVSLSHKAKKLANEMSKNLNIIQDYSTNLRVLDSNIKKSKTHITDIENMVEFYVKRPRISVD